MLVNVRTKYGEVEGTVSEKGYSLFKELPYTAPPVGDLRWKPPAEPAAWEGIRKCDSFGPACMQEITFTDKASGYGKEFYAGGDYPPVFSEDCLYLNVWTPAGTGDERLPGGALCGVVVYVWYAESMSAAYVRERLQVE